MSILINSNVIEVVSRGVQGIQGPTGLQGAQTHHGSKSGYMGSGGVPAMSKTSPTTISISGGQFLYVKYDSLPNVTYEIKQLNAKPVHTMTTVAPATVAYMYVDLRDMSIVESQTIPATKPPYYSYLGNIDFDSNDIDVNVFIETSYSISSTTTSLLYSRGDYNLSGNVYSGNANLSLSHTAGTGLRLGANTRFDLSHPDIISTDANQIAFIARTHVDASGTVIIDRHNTNIDPTKYVVNGALSDVGTNEWTVQYLYHFYGSNVVVVYYGNSKHASYANAANTVLSTPPVASGMTKEASLRAAIIVRGGATNLSAVGDATFVTF